MPDLRNPEFEAEVSKYKNFIDGYEKATRETVEEYIKVFSLNWTARNDFAKIIIALASAILALTVTFASGTLFKTFPQDLIRFIYYEWALLMMTLLFGVTSLWLYITVTKAHILFFEQQPQFIKKVELMVQHGRFEKEFFDGIFLRPFEKIYKYDQWSYRCLSASVVFFVCSLVVLCGIGWLSFSTPKPMSAMNRNIVSSAYSSGLTPCGCLPVIFHSCINPLV